MPLRTLNIINDIPNIATRLQINIAYDSASGLTLHDAKEFERTLESEIQALLYRFAHKTTTDVPFDLIRFIPLEVAMELTQHPTPKAFQHWRARHHSRYPHAPIIIRNNLVELNSLQRALEATAHGKDAA